MKALEKSAGDGASEILMSLQNWSGSFLVGEGPSDYKFWLARRSDQCEVIIATGRFQVEHALQMLNQNGIAGTLGVVDDDSDTLTAKVLAIPNVISTEPRELEGIQIRSSALEHVLSELGDAGKIENFLRDEPPSVREAIVRRAELFGRIHWLNAISSAKVCLEALKPQRFCDVGTWTYDERRIKDEAVRLGVRPNIETLELDLAALPSEDRWLVCRGHDLVSILVGGLLSVLGNGSARNDAVASFLRVGFSDSAFLASLLFQRTNDWERRNPPWRILR